jgi:hypothetical protein
VGAALAVGLVVLTLGVQVRRWVEYAGTPERYLEHWAGVRREVEDSLVRMGGKHVVLVRYGPEHRPDFELVYDGADVDGSPVVWARSLGPEQDARVVSYYSGRTAWVLAVDSDRAAPIMRPWPTPEKPGS